jgi:hypothetical protein
LQDHDSGAWAPFDLDQGDSCNGSALDRRLETCRELLPTSIAKALDLDDFDVTSALETTGKSSDAIKNEFNGPVNGCVTAIAEEG